MSLGLGQALGLDGALGLDEPEEAAPAPAFIPRVMFYAWAWLAIAVTM